MKTYRGRALISGIFIGFGLGLLLFGWATIVPGATSSNSLRYFWTPAIVGIIFIAVGIIIEVYCRVKLKVKKTTDENIENSKK